MNPSVQVLQHVPCQDFVAPDQVGQRVLLGRVLGGDLPEDDDLGEELLAVARQCLERDVPGAEGSGDGVEGLPGKDDPSGGVVGVHDRKAKGRPMPWQ